MVWGVEGAEVVVRDRQGPKREAKECMSCIVASRPACRIAELGGRCGVGGAGVWRSVGGGEWFWKVVANFRLREEVEEMEQLRRA